MIIAPAQLRNSIARYLMRMRAESLVRLKPHWPQCLLRPCTAIPRKFCSARVVNNAAPYSVVPQLQIRAVRIRDNHIDERCPVLCFWSVCYGLGYVTTMMLNSIVHNILEHICKRGINFYICNAHTKMCF